METVEHLLRKIRLGEDSELELKQVHVAGSRVTAPAREAFADELAAFANGRGGTLILGVDDKSREILGVPLDHLDTVEAWVREVCNDLIQPSLDASILKKEIPDELGKGVPIVCVEVKRSLFVHKSPGGYYRRIGSSKREMPPEVLARLFQERSQSRVIRFDESLVAMTSPEDLDPALVNRFLRREGSADLPTLEKLRLIGKDDDGSLRVTIAGVLMGCLTPQRWLPHAEIQAVAYQGSRRDINYQLDALSCEGPLDVQVSAALSFVRRNMKITARKPMDRREVPQFAERAVFEALVNAVAHRDYSMAGARIRLHMFSDHLELYVPGALANTLTPESLPLRQYSRNELVVSLLARCPASSVDVGRSFMMDRRGDGVPIILDETLKLSGRPAEYRLIDESELQLVMWGANP